MANLSTRRHLNHLATQHVKSRNTPVTLQKVAKGVGDMRAQIKRTYDYDTKLKKLQERSANLERQMNQSEVLAQLYREKIEYLVEAWPILEGVVESDTVLTKNNKAPKEAPVWAFHTLSSAYYELNLEEVRVVELHEAICDTTNEILHIEMDVCELHEDMSAIAEVYKGTNAWQAFPYEACAECLSRTAFCDVRNDYT